MKKSLILLALAFSSQSFAEDISFSSSIVDSSSTLNDKPATIIYAVNSDSNYCTITILSSLIKTGITLHSKQRSNSNNYTITCDWNGTHFTESNKKESSSSLTFESPKQLIIDFNLASSKGDNSLSTKTTTLLLK